MGRHTFIIEQLKHLADSESIWEFLVFLGECESSKFEKSLQYSFIALSCEETYINPESIARALEVVFYLYSRGFTPLMVDDTDMGSLEILSTYDDGKPAPRIYVSIETLVVSSRGMPDLSPQDCLTPWIHQLLVPSDHSAAGPSVR